jgi:hypothetical protein
MPRKNPEFARKIQDNIEKWRNYWKDNKNQYDDFTQFTWGNQWLDDEARVFETYKKIPLTFNKVAPLINHLVGEQRQNTPSLQVAPNENVPEETAETREALVKDITFDSESKVAFQIAFQCAAVGGFGAFRIITEYEHDNSFDQVIRIKPIPIPTRCFWDQSAENSCKTDGMYCGFTLRMSRKKFKSIYGKKIEQEIANLTLDDEENTVFNDDDAITMIYYFHREYSTIKLRQLSNGRAVEPDEFKRLERIDLDGDEILLDQSEPVTVADERLVPRYKVKFCLYAGEYELESEDFPSEQLPVPFVDQNSFFDKEGRQICRPFIKDAKDAQRYINYIGTQSAHLLKVSRYDQFLVSKKNVRNNDTAQIWRDPTNIQGGLIFDESDTGFIPQQLKPPELSQALVQQYERALMDIQSCTGMYNAQLGEQGNEVSGTAVDARTKRGAKNTYIPYDNLNRAIACAGQIIDEMIPRVYDTQRTLMINLKDKGMSPVDINKPMDEYGAQMQNDMVNGKYTIRLLPGPSFEGQKEEALNSMRMILEANPQLFTMIADLYVENLPLANNLELRNRLKTLVPPEIIQAGKTGEPIPPKPPEPNPEMMMAQAKMQEMQLKQEHLKLEQQKLQTQAQETGMGIQQKWQELEDKRVEAAAKLQEAELRYLAEVQRTQADQNIAHANNLVNILTHKENKSHGTE